MRPSLLSPEEITKLNYGRAINTLASYSGRIETSAAIERHSEASQEYTTLLQLTPQISRRKYDLTLQRMKESLVQLAKSELPYLSFEDYEKQATDSIIRKYNLQGFNAELATSDILEAHSVCICNVILQDTKKFEIQRMEQALKPLDETLNVFEVAKKIISTYQSDYFDHHFLVHKVLSLIDKFNPNSRVLMRFVQDDFHRNGSASAAALFAPHPNTHLWYPHQILFALRIIENEYRLLPGNDVNSISESKADKLNYLVRLIGTVREKINNYMDALIHNFDDENQNTQIIQELLNIIATANNTRLSGGIKHGTIDTALKTLHEKISAGQSWDYVLAQPIPTQESEVRETNGLLM